MRSGDQFALLEPTQAQVHRLLEQFGLTHKIVVRALDDLHRFVAAGCRIEDPACVRLGHGIVGTVFNG